MRSYVFFIAAILFFAQNTCLLAQAKEVNETEVKAAFIKYLESPWSKRADLMTPSSWNDYVGDMLYAYKDAATALLIEYNFCRRRSCRLCIRSYRNRSFVYVFPWNARCFRNASFDCRSCSANGLALCCDWSGNRISAKLIREERRTIKPCRN